MSKYITFSEQPALPGRKTSVWIVQSKAQPDIPLGEVKWFGPWRRYAFQPTPGIFDWGCLREVADLCEAATNERREARRARQPGL